MSLVRTLLERRTMTTTANTPAAWLLEALGGAKTSAGQTISPSTAEAIPTVYACVNILAETIGQLPLKLLRKTNDGKEEARDHPLYSVLHDLANPYLTASGFREVMMRWLLLWGGAYAEIERDSRGQVKWLWPLATDRMTVENTDGFLTYRYRLQKGGERVWRITDYDNPPILHLEINSQDGITGRSPITILRESLGLTKAADEHAARFFGNGALPDIILSKKGPGGMSKNAKQHFIESWKEKFKGSANAHGVALLEEEFTVHNVTMPMRDAQFLEVRGFQVEEAARMYRVPLFLLQHNTKETSWGSGIEHMGLGFVNFTLAPHFTRWTQAIARDLLTKKSFETHEAAFVVNALVRGDIKTRYEGYSIGRQNGFLSGNDIRQLEDLNNEDGLSDYWQPQNMTVIGAPPEPVGSAPPPADQPVPGAGAEGEGKDGTGTPDRPAAA